MKHIKTSSRVLSAPAPGFPYPDEGEGGRIRRLRRGPRGVWREYRNSWSLRKTRTSSRWKESGSCRSSKASWIQFLRPRWWT